MKNPKIDLTEKHSLRLGKSKATKDPNGINLRSVMREPMAIPDEYDARKQYPGAPLSAYGNQQYGDCVMAGQYKQLNLNELRENGKLPGVTPQDVVNEYFRQTGGADNGLNMLQSLKSNVKNGLPVGRKRYYSFGLLELHLGDFEGQRQMIYSRVGSYSGVLLPKSAEKEIGSGKPWSITTGPGSTPGSWGGHLILIHAYSKKDKTFLCDTWGQLQLITEAWLKKYQDESRGLIDAVDNQKAKRLIDMLKFTHLKKAA